MTRPPELYQYLATYAKAAIERLDAAADVRTSGNLDFLLDRYAANQGAVCDEHTRRSAHHICARRFAGTFHA